MIASMDKLLIRDRHFLYQVPGCGELQVLFSRYQNPIASIHSLLRFGMSAELFGNGLHSQEKGGKCAIQ